MAIRSGGNRRRMLLLVILSALFLPPCGILTEVGSTPAAPAAGWGHPQGVVLIIGAHRNAPAPSLDQRLDSPGVDDLEALSVAADAARSAGHRTLNWCCSTLALTTAALWISLRLAWFSVRAHPVAKTYINRTI